MIHEQLNLGQLLASDFFRVISLLFSVQELLGLYLYQAHFRGLALASKYFLGRIKGELLCEKEIFAGHREVFSKIKIVNQEIGKEQYSPAEPDPTCINETAGHPISQPHFMSPYGPAISHLYPWR